MLKIFETEAELAQAVAGEMLTQLENENEPMFCLAAGSTGTSSFKTFSDEVSAEQLEKFRFASLDEWVGVSGDVVGTCYQMLNDDLFKRLPIVPEQVTFFETKGTDLAAECAKLDATIAARPLTFSLMGVGMNGHIGLNEPGMPVLDHASVVKLSDTTKRVMQKYFDEEVALQEGITLGLAQILSSKHVIVALIGAHKADIAKEIFENPGANLPAQYFLNRGNVDFYLDAAAASKLIK